MAQTPHPYGAPEEEERIEAALPEQARLGKLSLEVSMALIAGKTLPEMLTACTEAMVRYLDASFARIWLLNEEERVLELQASSGMYTHLGGGHARVPLGALKIGLIAAERRPYLTNEVQGDASIGDQAWAKREGMVAFAGYPLLVEERLIGVIAMFARHRLNDSDLQAMATVANGIALGVERSRMQKERERLLARERAARIEVEEAHQRLYDLVMQAPALICFLRGPQHVYELVNPLYLQLVGHRDIIGKPIREALPELAGQGFYELLDQVYASGTPFIGKEMRVAIDRYNDGMQEEAYFNFMYQPSRNAAGEVDGILVHAVEVTEQVRTRESAQNSQERLELAQLAGHIGTFEWDIQHDKILWTPALEALYGLPPGGFGGKSENWAERIHPDDLKQTEESLREAITANVPYNVEFRAIWPDGTIRWMLAKGKVTSYDAKGQPLHMIGVNIDITELKEAEQEKARIFQSLQDLNQSLQDLNANLEATVAQRTEVLNQLNTELQRSNQELQDFAYVASHDLQEPLRKIQAFGNLLEEEYGQALGDGKAYLDRMRNAATRMRTLINDLLAFSRVTTKALPFSPVDLNAIAYEVVDDLESQIRATQGVVEIKTLPMIEADPLQMRQMFQNLIGNALKFHKPDNPPVVKVYAEVQPVATDMQESAEQQCVLFVEDNGIGFDEKYLDRIFTVFQRLHGKGDYEGTGIGLAVVRKIVERHGGTITARTTVGEGATFIVTLPMQHP